VRQEPLMLGQEKALDVLQRVLALSDADRTEAILTGAETRLTRYANNYIHQNVVERQLSITIKTTIGQRTGIAVTGRTDEEGLREAVRRAVETATVTPPDPDLPPLPQPRPVPTVDAFCAATAGLSARERAERAGAVIKKAQKLGLVASGSFSVATYELAVANSEGVAAYHPQTRANLVAIVSGEDSSGYASALSVRAEDIDVEAKAEVAIRKCLEGRNPRPLEPGVYEVVLEPEAVSDVIGSLALAFNGQWVREGRSPFANKLGQRVFAPVFHLWDDPLSSEGIPLPFDFEGVPKSRMELVTAGVVAGFVYNTYTAAKEGRESTGHALPPQARTFGAFPAHLFMGTGDSGSSLDMAARMQRGLLVTRFNYNRVVHPVKMVITGLTRDGVWYVEDGKVRHPVSNLRYTQSILEALNDIRGIGSQRELKSFFGLGSCCVPALHLGSWSFTGDTRL